jgi:phosphoglycolate phosphatase
MLGAPAERCVYVGDDLRDVQASIAAQMKPWVALWGYLGDQTPPGQWGASQLLQSPADLRQSLLKTAPPG